MACCLLSHTVTQVYARMHIFTYMHLLVVSFLGLNAITTAAAADDDDNDNDDADFFSIW